MKAALKLSMAVTIYLVIARIYPQLRADCSAPNLVTAPSY